MTQIRSAWLHGATLEGCLAIRGDPVFFLYLSLLTSMFSLSRNASVLSARALRAWLSAAATKVVPPHGEDSSLATRKGKEVIIIIVVVLIIQM